MNFLNQKSNHKNENLFKKRFSDQFEHFEHFLKCDLFQQNQVNLSTNPLSMILDRKIQNCSKAYILASTKIFHYKPLPAISDTFQSAFWPLSSCDAKHLAVTARILCGQRLHRRFFYGATVAAVQARPDGTCKGAKIEKRM